MKVVKAGFTPIVEKDPIKKVERIARVCYKSEEKIAKGTDVKMVERLIERQHYAMLEHASLCYIVSESVYYEVVEIIGDYMHFAHEEDKSVGKRFKMIPKIKYTEYNTGNETRFVVSGNLRAWIELFEWVEGYSRDSYWPDAIVLLHNNVRLDTKCMVSFTEQEKFMSTHYTNYNNKYSAVLVTDYSVLSPDERMIHETISILFTVDRGVTHEIVRMRECSFAQESTRYCNYILDKYGNEIAVIHPCFFPDVNSTEYEIWKHSCEVAENDYFALLRLGATPQQARDVLPTSVKADIVVTTNLIEWGHIFELRACDATGPAHPQMKEVMIPALESLQKEYDFAFGALVPAR